MGGGGGGDRLALACRMIFEITCTLAERNTNDSVLNAVFALNLVANCRKNIGSSLITLLLVASIRTISIKISSTSHKARPGM